MTLQVFCIEQLHRLPSEVDVPLSELYRGMIAFATVQKEREQAIESARRKASPL